MNLEGLDFSKLAPPDLKRAGTWFVIGALAGFAFVCKTANAETIITGKFWLEAAAGALTWGGGVMFAFLIGLLAKPVKEQREEKRREAERREYIPGVTPDRRRHRRHGSRGEARTVVLGLVLLGLVALLVWSFIAAGRRPEPAPMPTPDVELRPTPAPPEPEASPWIEDNDLPPRPAVPVCCCETPYGSCIDVPMAPEAARLHAVLHEHDLIGRTCVTATEEELALRRVLLRPEQIEAHGRNTLAMSDRAAFRERVKGDR